MNDLEFEPKLEGNRGFQADALIGHTVFEVLADPRDLRRFRSALMELAKILTVDSRFHGVLILDEPQIGDERLREEWFDIEILFRAEFVERITLVIRRENTPDQVFGSLTDVERNCIELVSERVRQRAFRPSRRPSEASFDILRVMLIHWLRRSGPLTSKDLSQETGFSYPTIARTLGELEPHLFRHSDRRVELNSFPKDEWFKLLAQVEKVRCSRGYTDRSGRPRQPETLLDRLRENSLRNLCHDSVAVGGTFGARHYLPGIDLFGNPRLDLIVDAYNGRRNHPVAIDTIIRKLDPALKPAERGEPCQVVIHTLYRAKSFFTEAKDGTLYADEVECLLDLHEARLEQQALEFLENLTPRKNA